MTNRGQRVVGVAALCWGTATLGFSGCAAKDADLGNSAFGGAAGTSAVPAVYAEGPPVFDSASPVVPFKLVRGNIDVYSLWSKGERIGWGDIPGPNQSCNVNDCARTLETVPMPDLSFNALYQIEYDWPEAYRVTLADSGASGYGYSRVDKVLFDGDVVYSGGRDYWILRCSIADCRSTLEMIPLRTPVGIDRSTDIGYTMVERIALDESYVYAFYDQTIVRVTKVGPFVDQNGDYIAFEPIVKRPVPMFGTRLYGDMFYWLEPDTNGSVRACPKTGCVGEPETVAAASQLVSSFTLDGENLYMLQLVSSGWSTGRILRCPIADCTSPTVLLESAELQSSSWLLVHGNHLLFVGIDPTGDPSTQYIGVIPK